MEGQMAIDVFDLCMNYSADGDSLPVLDNLTFHIDDGGFVAILGPSGCGKTTLLRILAGFISPSSGSVLKNGKVLDGPGSDRAIVMQQGALFPWLNVLENIAYPLKIQGMPADEREGIARGWLSKISLQDYEGYYPHQLSIGMQQRVAVARLFVGNAEVLLMDEPFGALDTITRLHSQRLLLQIWGQERRTVIFVTHDVEEALLIADRILVLGTRPGRLILDYPVKWRRPRDFNQVFSDDFVKARQVLLGLIGAS